MNANFVLGWIAVVLVADFVMERGLEWLNMRAMPLVLPANLKGMCNEGNMRVFSVTSGRTTALNGSVPLFPLP